MPSFDIVSKVDVQMLDNAINVTRKEITNRFDFKDTVVEIELNKKDRQVFLYLYFFHLMQRNSF